MQVRMGMELHGLLERALELADEESLSRLHDLLVYLSEGADLVDYACDVPEGLEHKPVFERMLKARRLLDAEPMGHA